MYCVKYLSDIRIQMPTLIVKSFFSVVWGSVACLLLYSPYFDYHRRFSRTWIAGSRTVLMWCRAYTSFFSSPDGVLLGISSSVFSWNTSVTRMWFMSFQLSRRSTDGWFSRRSYVSPCWHCSLEHPVTIRRCVPVGVWSKEYPQALPGNENPFARDCLIGGPIIMGFRNLLNFYILSGNGVTAATVV